MPFPIAPELANGESDNTSLGSIYHTSSELLPEWANRWDHPTVTHLYAGFATSWTADGLISEEEVVGIWEQTQKKNINIQPKNIEAPCDSSHDGVQGGMSQAQLMSKHEERKSGQI